MCAKVVSIIIEVACIICGFLSFIIDSAFLNSICAMFTISACTVMLIMDILNMVN